MSEILKTEGLCVSADEKELLHSVDISVGEGETHVLMGHNGAGKSTFGCTVMGSPEYTVTSGKIIFDGEDITKEETEYIIKNVREVVEYLRSFSPVWRDLMSGKAKFIL